MADRVPVGEQLIELRGRGIGAASEALVAAGEQRGYTVGAVGPGTFRLERSTRPIWATSLAIVLAPLLGLGLLFLRVRRSQSSVVTIYEDRRGVKARVVGQVDDEIIQHLAGPPQTVPVRGTAGTTASATAGMTSRPAPALAPLVSVSEVPETVPMPVERRTEIAAMPGLIGADAPNVDETIARPGRSMQPGSPAPGWTLELPNGRTLSITGSLLVGRQPAPGDDAAVTVVAVDDPSLSKTHVRIDLAGGVVLVTDQRSTNGTVVRTGTGTTTCTPGVALSVTGEAVVFAGEAEFRLTGGPT